MDCPSSRDDFSAKGAQKFVVVNASESPNLCSSRNSNELSTNSTDNLSYSPHDHGDDVIFQNTLSDEDEHGSVDCIYAYRGAGAERDEEQILNNNENDDETDFLEMDFDPDPPSEVEQNINVCNSAGFDQQELFEKEILLMNEQILKSVEKTSNNYIILNKEMKNVKISEKINDILDEKNLQNKCKALVSEDCVKEIKFESTGAKPKKCNENRLMNGNRVCNINYKNKRQQLQAQNSYDNLNKTNRIISNTKEIKENDHFYSKDLNEMTDDICLDCLEKEFLSKIIGKDVKPITLCNKCKTNQNKSLKTFCESSILTVNNNNNINLPLLESFNRFETFDLNNFPIKSNCVDGKLLEANQNSKLLTCDNAIAEPILNLIKISSINNDASTIIQALIKLNIKFDESIIYKYMDKQNTYFSNLCEFVLFSSKWNCNYKRLIKMLKTAIKEKIKVEFQFDETKVNETVQIKAYDILYYWQMNNDLRGIQNLDRKFKEMNVLGKLVNKIRQAQQRVKKQQLNDFITIPQYYRSGYITIKKP